MVEVLERIAEKDISVSVSEREKYMGGRDYSGEGALKDTGYSAFAEMYLEKPVEVQAGFSVTVCTWRGIPTVDDW